jgi:hypothetical protein
LDEKNSLLLVDSRLRMSFDDGDDAADDDEVCHLRLLRMVPSAVGQGARPAAAATSLKKEALLIIKTRTE